MHLPLWDGWVCSLCKCEGEAAARQRHQGLACLRAQPSPWPALCAGPAPGPAASRSGLLICGRPNPTLIGFLVGGERSVCVPACSSFAQNFNCFQINPQTRVSSAQISWSQGGEQPHSCLPGPELAAPGVGRPSLGHDATAEKCPAPSPALLSAGAWPGPPLCLLSAQPLS